MKEQLISLSEEKGFKSNILAFNLKLLISTDKNEINRLYYYLWMCEIQKWLREKHNFITWIECAYHDGFNYIPNYKYKILDFFDNNEWDLLFHINYDTYEDALEFLLFEALKLIK